MKGAPTTPVETALECRVPLREYIEWNVVGTVDVPVDVMVVNPVDKAVEVKVMTVVVVVVKVIVDSEMVL